MISNVDWFDPTLHDFEPSHQPTIMQRHVQHTSEGPQTCHRSPGRLVGVCATQHLEHRVYRLGNEHLIAELLLRLMELLVAETQ